MGVGGGDARVGVLTAVPYAVAAIGMVAVGRHSDRTGERRWHFAIPQLTAALALSAGEQAILAELLHKVACAREGAARR